MCPKQVHSKSKRSDFEPISQVERLRKRVAQLEAIARLNGETIRNMQRAAAEAESRQYRTSSRSGARN